ncbi:MAG: SpoIIE family protein phosphatase [Oscillospiraceae bacterium]|jgi:stage II sporulation protein E|nr:SpoIIE family protein phosphatase [Oscillospiraceae bacterium]
MPKPSGKSVTYNYEKGRADRKFGAKMRAHTGGLAEVLHNDVFVTWCDAAIRFLIAFLLAGIKLFSGISPFSIGFAAAAVKGRAKYATYLGSAAGYLLFLPWSSGLTYLSALALIFGGGFLLPVGQARKKLWVIPLLTLGVSCFCGAIVASSGGLTAAEAAIVLADGTIAAVSCVFYGIALFPSRETSIALGTEFARVASIIILLSTVLMSLAELTVGGVISLGRTVASLVVFCVSYTGGVGFGCAFGVAVGLSMDAVSPGYPIFGLAYGLSGLVAGMFSKRSKLAFAILYVVVNAAVSVLAVGTESVPGILYEVFIASCAFMLLPQGAMSRIEQLLPDPLRARGADSASIYTRERARAAARAFAEVCGETAAVREAAAKPDNPAVIFSRAADLVCRECQNAPVCWNKNFERTTDACNNALAVISAKGVAEPADFPRYFKENCIHMEDFCQAASREYQRFRRQRRQKAASREARGVLYEYCAEISEILESFADDIVAPGTASGETEERISRYLRGLGIHVQAAVFRDTSGRLHVDLFGACAEITKTERWLERLSVCCAARLCLQNEKHALTHEMHLLEAEKYAASIGISRTNRDGEVVSGDICGYFKTPEGKIYIILTDGMGSGEDAHNVSAEAQSVLQKFIRSGVAPRAAIKMLNGLLLLRNEEKTTCCAVDVAELDLFTGVLELYKCGAAQSYIRAGGIVQTVLGEGLAAGLLPPSGISDEQTKAVLRAGDLLVMVSDGIPRDRLQNRLTAIISEFSPKRRTPGELSREIAELAAETTGAEDDISAIAVYIKEI